MLNMTEENKEEMHPIQPVRPRAKRRIWLKVSFILCVILPTFLGTIYTTFFASDRYVTSAGFSVRTVTTSGGADYLGAFTGLAGSGSTTSDAYMLLNFLESRDLLDRLQQDFDFRAIYGAESIDWPSRLRPDLDIEKVLKYWARRIQTSFDPTSGIITFEVQGFSPEDSLRVAELVLGYSKELVNALSEQARSDAVSFAEGEVARAEERQLAALRDLRKFRELGESLDPAASALAQIEILAGLEKSLLSVRSRMAALETTVDPDAPSLSTLRRQAEALEKQIAEKSGGIRMSGTENDLSELLAEYEELQVEKSFAQKAYASALGSLETARVEAGRQQRYLAVYSQPSLPEFPLYPRKILYPVLMLVVSAGLWGIGTLMVYAVRDHLS
jgi:capsular polysaccharide transport system permease protein